MAHSRISGSENVAPSPSKLAHLSKKSCRDFQNKEKVDWTKDWAGQVVICANQVYWTVYMEEGIREGSVLGAGSLQPSPRANAVAMHEQLGETLRVLVDTSICGGLACDTAWLAGSLAGDGAVNTIVVERAPAEHERPRARRRK